MRTKTLVTATLAMTLLAITLSLPSLALAGPRDRDRDRGPGRREAYSDRQFRQQDWGGPAQRGGEPIYGGDLATGLNPRPRLDNRQSSDYYQTDPQEAPRPRTRQRGWWGNNPPGYE